MVCSRLRQIALAKISSSSSANMRTPTKPFWLGRFTGSSDIHEDFDLQ